MSAEGDIVQTLQESRNLLERISAAVSPEDDILEAVLQNQRIIIDTLQRVQGVDPDNLPRGLAGITLEEIKGGNKGKAIFDVDGKRIIATVNPGSKTGKREPVIVDGSGNSVIGTNRASKDDIEKTGVALGGRTSIRTDVAKDFEDFSDGITADPVEAPNTTIYLESKGAVDLEIELSPDGGNNWYELPNDSPVKFSTDEVVLLEFEYDFDKIRFTSDSETGIKNQIFQTV